MPEGVGRGLSSSFSLPFTIEGIPCRAYPAGHKQASKQGEGPTLTLPLMERGFQGDAKSRTVAPTGR